ncbi:MAG: lipoate--protein ligase [Bacteroidota bacterium]
MILIESKSNNPYFNIATEDYLLHQFSEDVFFLYIDEPSVICGKHQNALAEINVNYVDNQKISVVRRLSGGGTVYHDMGNLNFCFIINATDGKLVDFKKHTLPLLKALELIGVNPILGERNDIIIEGFKVSGNAEHVWKNRVLHHGTLLFNSDLSQLSEAIQTSPSRFEDKSVKSKRSKVANISSFIDRSITLDLFKKKIIDVVSMFYEITNVRLTTSQESEINKLVDSKYSTWEWNFGYSPKYTFKNSLISGDLNYSILLFVDKGVIKNAEFLINDEINEFWSSEILGNHHKSEDLIQLFNGFLSEKVIKSLFFGD